MHYNEVMSTQTNTDVIPQQVMPQGPSLVDVNPADGDAATKAANEVAAQANLALAQGLVQQIEALMKSSPERAQMLLGQLQAIPIIAGTSVSGAMASVVLQGMGDQNAITTAETEAVLARLADEVVTASVSDAKFRQAERDVLAKLSPELKEMLKAEFSEDSYKAMDIAVSPDGKVTTTPAKEVSGAEARDAATTVSAATLRGKDRKEVREKQGMGDAVTPEESEKQKQSIDVLKKVTAAKIVEGDGTDAEKKAALDRTQKAAERATRKAAQVQQAEKAERELPAAMKPVLGGALRSNTEKLREEYAMEVEGGILKEATTDRKPSRGQGREQAQGQEQGQRQASTREPQRENAPDMRQGVEMAQNAPPPPTPGMQRGGAGMGRA
jgi:hypothetical protein